MISERVPKILVGSSTEGLDIARAFKAALEPGVEVTLWADDFFTPGEYTLETLESRSRVFDGGLIVGTLDDKVLSRGTEFESIRDNLLLEFGIFVAVFGRRKAILAMEGLGSSKMPSDLFGLTCVGFDRSKPAAGGVAAAALQIQRVVGTFAVEVLEQHISDSLQQVLRTFIGDLQEALGSPPQIGFHVWVVDERLDPPRLIRVARSRTTPKAMLGTEFAFGEGITGECWRTASSVYVDFSEEPYRSIKEGDWDEFGLGVRKGMSYGLLDKSRSRYRAVGAAPLISDISSGSRFLGCLSYNIGQNVPGLDKETRFLDVEKVLDRACEVVRIILES